MMGTMPRVSIITPSYNQGQFITETIESVLAQTYPNIEYIVMDGGSTDDTLAILKQYDGRLQWYSEPDEGQTDAINKGFRRATGDIIAWLNSDDLYFPDTVETVVNYLLKSPDHMFVYGDVVAIDDRGKVYGRRHHVHQTNFHELLHGSDPIVQPGSFWRKTLWDELGELDTNLHYVMDYEYWLRIAQRYPLYYLPKALAKERIYANAKTYHGAMQRIEEIDQVTKAYGNDAFPTSFRNEAAALYLQQAIGQSLRRKWGAAKQHFAKVWQFRPAPHKMLFYFLLIVLPGNWFPRLWLWRSRLAAYTLSLRGKR